MQQVPPAAVTVLILNWNGQKWLARFLPSVLATSYPATDVLVADNGSTDNSVAFLKAQFPEVKVLELGYNYGFAEGNNRAIAHIHTPYVALLNSDVEVSENWLQPLVEAIESDERIAAVQPKILAEGQRSHFEYAGAAGGWMDRFLYPFCRGRLFDTVEADKGQYDQRQDIFWASGACCLLRRSVIEEIGLFEPEFFAHMEEIDFCWKAHNHGYRILCEPSGVVYHVGGGTLKQGSPRKTLLNVRNSLAMLYKNLPARQRFFIILMRLLLDGVWGAKCALKNDWKTVGAILKGHLQFYRTIPIWRARRRQLYANRAPQALSQIKGFYGRSIVWQYYLRGKKTFSSLPEIKL